MDQPAGLQVDYIFRGVEHAVRVVVSGQVLELEVEDQMTADQWRGEFDANCECASWVGSSPSPGPPKAELSRVKLFKVGGSVDLARGSGAGKAGGLELLPLGWASGQTSGGTFLSTQSLKT